MTKLIHFIEAINVWVGRTIAWLTLVMVLITVYQVVMRYVFNIYSIALQELVLYAFAMVLMFGTPYALQLDEHVRVDVFYRNFSSNTKAWANLFGTIFFLLPFAVLVLVFSWDYTLDAWRMKEGSGQANGLPYVYLLKTTLPITAVLLILQAIADILRNILTLKGHVFTRGER